MSKSIVGLADDPRARWKWLSFPVHVNRLNGEITREGRYDNMRADFTHYPHIDALRPYAYSRLTSRKPPLLTHYDANTHAVLFTSRRMEWSCDVLHTFPDGSSVLAKRKGNWDYTDTPGLPPLAYMVGYQFYKLLDEPGLLALN